MPMLKLFEYLGVGNLFSAIAKISLFNLRARRNRWNAPNTQHYVSSTINMVEARYVINERTGDGSASIFILLDQKDLDNAITFANRQFKNPDIVALEREIEAFLSEEMERFYTLLNGSIKTTFNKEWHLTDALRGVEQYREKSKEV